MIFCSHSIMSCHLPMQQMLSDDQVFDHTPQEIFPVNMVALLGEQIALVQYA